jgi:hypothetical protein
MPAESVHLKWKSTVLEGKTKGIAVNLTTMPIFKNLFITISTTLKRSFFVERNLTNLKNRFSSYTKIISFSHSIRL